DHRARAAAEVDRDDRERLVHRHHEVAGAVDALARAERLRDRLAECDAEILDGMVLIDVEIAGRVDPEIEGAVAGDELQHVIEKPDAGPHVVPALALEAEPQGNLRFRRSPIDYRAAHRTSSITATARCVFATMPVAMRRHPAHPGSVDRSRR